MEERVTDDWKSWEGRKQIVTNGMGYMPFFQGTEGNVLTLAADPRNRWIPREYALQQGIDLSLAENPNARFL